MDVLIEKFVFGGQGMGRLSDGRVAFVWNALPGETVRIEILKKKKEYVEAIATEIVDPSPDRVTPRDPHFLSTSPWQVISWEKENSWKSLIAKETYAKIGDMILEDRALPIVSDTDHQYGYRNKMEFSFAELANGEISLAFFERGKNYRSPVTDSALADESINQTAHLILEWINTQHIPIRSLKSLIVRSAQTSPVPATSSQTIAALFIKDELSFDAYPALNSSLVGFHVFYSTHKSPASVPTKLLYSAGDNFLTQSILNTPLRFGLLSFFQVNVPIFEKAVERIASFVDPHLPLVDFYSGVGAISLPLSKTRVHATLVDNNSEAIDFAQQNIDLNHLAAHCSATCLPAEKMTDVILEDSIVIVDPPRAGLHSDVVKALLVKQPSRVIYLSCDIATQARDLRLLSQVYAPISLELYNFFPRTPHIEGLAVLDRLSA